MEPNSIGRKRRLLPNLGEYRVPAKQREKDVPAGTMAMVSSTDFVRASERATAIATAIATLNRQRHLTPSCGGFAPTAERTVGPARISLESLTPRPGIREQYRPRPEEEWPTRNTTNPEGFWLSGDRTRPAT